MRSPCGGTDPAGPENRPRNTTTSQLFISEEIAAQGRPRPDADKESTSGACASLAGVPTNRGKATGEPQEKAALDSALRGFPAFPGLVLQIAPAFRDHVPSAVPSWGELVQAAFEVCLGLGISAEAWGQACVVLGRVEATLAVAAIAAKHAQGRVKLPGGYLRKMVQKHQNGQLRLDKTLFGLAAGLRDPAPACAAARNPAGRLF